MAKPSALSFEDKMYHKLREGLVGLEKKNNVANYGFSSNFQNRMSTNLLSFDLMLGGGVIPGYWYTMFGPEQSAKSTASMQIMMAGLKQDVPNIHLYDFEASSGDSDYLIGQMKTNKIKMGLDELYGVRNKNGSWAIQPKVDYYSDDVLETFFDLESSFLRRMPDKFMRDGKWWYGFDNDKYGKSMVEGGHDRRMFQQTGKLCVPATDGRMQSLIIVDSYSAMTPESMDEDDPASGLAAKARAFSANIDRVRGKLRRKRCTVIGVNQLRKAPMVRFGSPEYEPNGEALKFASAVRVKMTPRVIPPWFDSGAKGMFMEEPAVGGGTDTYRFVHARTHKNKLSSANQETWLRIWTEDVKKQGRGFDSVFDTYQYLRMTGQCSGTRKKITITVPGFERSKNFDWMSFKTLILGSKEEIAEVLRKHGVIKKGEPPFLLRNVLAKQMDSGLGMDLYVKARQAAKGKASSDGDDEG